MKYSEKGFCFSFPVSHGNLEVGFYWNGLCKKKQVKFKVWICSSESMIICHSTAVANTDSHLESGSHAESEIYNPVTSTSQ